MLSKGLNKEDCVIEVIQPNRTRDDSTCSVRHKQRPFYQPSRVGNFYIYIYKRSKQTCSSGIKAVCVLIGGISSTCYNMQ